MIGSMYRTSKYLAPTFTRDESDLKWSNAITVENVLHSLDRVKKRIRVLVGDKPLSQRQASH